MKWLGTILKNLGEKGFYSNTLFPFEKEFIPYLKSSIELGRSFVQPKYWGTRALDYLWYGIGAYLKKNPHIKYMFGPVSISDTLPKIAKDMLVFYFSHYFKEKRTLISTRSPFQYSSSIIDLKDKFNLNDKKIDFRFLKSSLSTMDVAVPTLYKQYSELTNDNGVKFLGFNIDKEFANCVDGFILVEVDKIKDSTKKRYINRD